MDFPRHEEGRFGIYSYSAFKCATACLLGIPTPSSDPCRVAGETEDVIGVVPLERVPSQ